MSVGTHVVAVVAAAIITAAFAAAPPGLPQHALADATPSPINLGAVGSIADDDSLYLYEIYEIATFESAGRTYAAVVSGEGVQVLDLTDPRNIVPAGRIPDDDRPDLLGMMQNIVTFESAGRTYAAVVSLVDVQVLDLTDPRNIVPAGRIAHDHAYPTYSFSIDTFESSGGTYATVSWREFDSHISHDSYGMPKFWSDNKGQVMQVLNLTDPDDITRTSNTIHDGHQYGIYDIAAFKSSGRTYAAVASSEGVQVLDLTDPQDIVPAGRIGDDGSLYLKRAAYVATFESSGRTYAAVASSEGVQVLDLTDPRNIVPAGRIGNDGLYLHYPKDMVTIELFGRTYAAVTSLEGVQVLDLTDPQNIVPAGRIDAFLSQPITAFESSDHAYAVVGLYDSVQVILLADDADRAAYGKGQDDMPVTLVITTHNPACTAVHLDYLGVTRLTDVQPWYRNGTFGYTHDEIANGVNVTAAIWARDSNMTIPSILERPEVSTVATYYYIAPNSTETPALLDQANNTGAIWPDVGLPTKCGTLRPHMILLVMDVVGWDGAEPGTGPAGLEPGVRGGAGSADGIEPGEPATTRPTPPTLDNLVGERVDPESGLLYIGDMVGVEISTYNTTAVWAYLKENGALVTNVSSVRVESFVPPSLLVPLSLRDDVYNIVELVVDMLEEYGGINTEGLLPTVRPSVEQWHSLGYNGPGSNVGVIYSSFAGIGAASSDLPGRVFAETAPTQISLTVASNITDDYGLFRYSGGVKDIATFESAGRAYAAVTSRDDVQVLNLTDPYNIVLAGRIGNLGGGYMSSGLKITTFESAGRAYAVVVSGADVQVLNLTDPDNIVLADSIAHDFGPGVIYRPGLATFESAGRAYAIVSVFLGDMICIYEPFNPTYDCPDYDDTTILQVLDLTDPDNIFPTTRIVYDGLHPYHSNHIATFESAGRAYAVTVTKAVNVLNRTEAVQVLNLTDPSTFPAGRIVPAGSIADDDRLHLKHARSITTFESAGRAYAAVVSSEGVQVLDLTDPDNIIPAGHIAYDLWLTGATNIATFESDGRAYAVVSMYGGMEMLDLTDPDNIVPVGHIAYGNDFLTGATNIATFESDGRAYAVVGLVDNVRVIQLTANADRAAYGVARADATVTYEVVTSEPVCDAEYLDRLEAVTRLTLLNDGHLFNTMSGIPIHIQVSEGQAQDVAQSLLGRPSVISVQRVGPFPNVSDAEWPAEFNPDAATREVTGGCYDNIDTILEFKIREAIIQQDRQSGDVSGADPGGSGFEARVARGELYVRMYVNNITSIVEYLEANGALVTFSGTGEYEGKTIRQVSAVIPPLLAIQLSERDDFRSMRYYQENQVGVIGSPLSERDDFRP